MRMDTVIMGGGLSALACGISLAKRGKRVTIVASGQSTMLFNGGSMELLGCIDGKPVEKPLEAIATLPGSHPYSKIGADRIAVRPLVGDHEDRSGIVADGFQRGRHAGEISLRHFRPPCAAAGRARGPRRRRNGRARSAGPACT